MRLTQESAATGTPFMTQHVTTLLIVFTVISIRGGDAMLLGEQAVDVRIG